MKGGGRGESRYKGGRHEGSEDPQLEDAHEEHGGAHHQRHAVSHRRPEEVLLRQPLLHGGRRGGRGVGQEGPHGQGGGGQEGGGGREGYGGGGKGSGVQCGPPLSPPHGCFPLYNRADHKADNGHGADG